MLHTIKNQYRSMPQGGLLLTLPGRADKVIHSLWCGYVEKCQGV